MTANFPKPFSGNLLKLDIPSVRLWDSAQAVRSAFPLAPPPLNLPQGIRLRYFGEGYPGCSPGPEARDCPRQPKTRPKPAQDDPRPLKTTQDPAPKPTTDNTRPPTICQGLRRRPGRSLLNMEKTIRFHTFCGDAQLYSFMLQCLFLESLQDGPEMALDSPKMVKDGPKMAQDGSRWLQHCFNLAPNTPNRSKHGSRWS